MNKEDLLKLDKNNIYKLFNDNGFRIYEYMYYISKTRLIDILINLLEKRNG